MATNPSEVDDGAQTEPVITPESRPSVSGDSSGADDPVGETVPDEATPPKAPRKPRRDKGSTRQQRSAADIRANPQSSSQRKRAKAEAGASILYGGVGVLLTASGAAPAAGFTMQGLADEAGVEIAGWAKTRSPRFYEFLGTITEAAGIGKFIAAPAAAEGYARAPQLRPALGPVIAATIGNDGAEQVHGIALRYDEHRADAGEPEEEQGAGEAGPMV